MSVKSISRKHPDKPFLVVGPCSAETEEQVMATATQLAGQEIELFRAGVWKPRTRPDSFEGVGEKGLRWLQRVREELGLRVCTEVAKAVHVEKALAYGLDVLWIGARTTVNPFSVQELADALAGVDIPVMIKNPINADLGLWIGAVERIYKAGVRQVALIHRGFSVYGKSPYRNVPRWQIPIEMRKEFPELLMLCDNSHICGKRDTLKEIAQRAFDLNYDGLMTEVHMDPDNAWSDAAQQITPVVFERLFADLIFRKEGNGKVENDLYGLRHQIDEIDKDLMDLLGRRMQIAQAIGGYKKAHNIAILQQNRWMEIFEMATKRAEQLGLSESFVRSFMQAIHEESIEQQMRVMSKED